LLDLVKHFKESCDEGSKDMGLFLMYQDGTELWAFVNITIKLFEIGCKDVE
jgi:hypothetical protein